MGNTVDVVRNMKRPRFARSHLPWHLLPKDLTTSKAKVSQMSTLRSNDFHRKAFARPFLYRSFTQLAIPRTFVYLFITIASSSMVWKHRLKSFSIYF